METTFSPKDFWSKLNLKLTDSIDDIDVPCDDFNLYCGPMCDVWGIWIPLDDTSYLIDNPFSLVSSLLGDQNMALVGFPDIENRQIQVYSQVKGHYIVWAYRRPQERSVKRLYFSFQTYIDKVRTALDGLQEILNQNSGRGHIIYKADKVTPGAIANCLRQLAIRAVLPGNHYVTTDEVEVEKFAFYPVADDNPSHEKYHIGIGNRGFDTFLTNWDSDYDRIRHQLENYVFEKEATVALTCDTSDTILKISRKSILDKVTPVGSGYTFAYKEYILTEITPCEFDLPTIFKGYCDEKQFLSMLYEGLLAMALTHPYDGDDYCDESPLLKAYNQLKSPLIENYISGLEEVERSDRTGHRRNLVAVDTDVARRQQIIKTIIQIDPDYDVCFHCLSEDRAPLSIDNDRIDDLLDINGEPIVIPGYSAWLQELEPVIIASARGKEYVFDWKTYHQRGIALARQLRAQLSDDIDLWYAAPFEDHSQQIPRPILIRKTYAPLSLQS